MTLHDLPAINGTLNGISAAFLGAGYVFIRQHKVRAHRACMIAAFTSSVLFLISYITYHVTVHTLTVFKNPAWFRPFYLGLLLSHTVLAAVIVPLVIITLSRAMRERFDKHRVIARWTLPLWMYVSITGVAVYLILYQIFPQHG